MLAKVLICIMFFILGLVIGFLISHLKTAKLQAENDFLKNQENNSDNLLELVKTEFVNLANNAILEKQQKMQEQNSFAIDEKFKPVLARIKEFQEKIETFNKTEIENNASLKQQLTDLRNANVKISEDAQKLTEALTKNQNVKGAWGETLLEVLLEKSGFVEGVHFEKHYSAKNPQNEQIYPDIVINLPNNKNLIIDSKFTLTSYIELCSENTKDSLDKFKREVKSRIDEIAKKDYINTQGLNQPEFVIIYIPLENSLAVIYQDKDLIQHAINKNIIVTGTSSLLVCTKLVENLWAREKHAQSAAKIAGAATTLYETFVTFCEDLKKIKKLMDDTSSTFQTAINRFTKNNPKNPSIFSQIDKLKEYGITTAKQIPKEFLESAEDNVN